MSTIGAAQQAKPSSDWPPSVKDSIRLQPQPSRKNIIMNITLWIITALLTLLFLAAGAMKIAQPKAKLAASGQGWVEDFSDSAIKGIGAAEILGAVGLILPAVLNIATVLVPTAATGLFLLMTGAASAPPPTGASKHCLRTWLRQSRSGTGHRWPGPVHKPR